MKKVIPALTVALIATVINQVSLGAKIHEEVSKGDVAGVRKLLADEPSAANARDMDHATPLHIAVAKKELAIVKLLIASKADPNSKDDNGLTPLHVACIAPDVGTDIVTSLINAGATISIVDEAGRTPLHYAAAGDPSIVKVLLANGANVNAKDKSGSTPLHWAAANGKIQAAKMLLDHGANASIRNSSDWAPLDVALHDGHADVADLLKERMGRSGSSKDATTKPDSETPLIRGFGISLHSSKVVLILNTGGVMVDSWDRVRQESLDFIRNLPSDDYFACVTVSDRASLLIKPEHTATKGDQFDLAKATDNAKHEFKQEIDKIEPEGVNTGALNPFVDAIHRAFLMRPDSIIFVSSNAFDAGVLKAVERLNTQKIPIHVVALPVDDEARDKLVDLARINNGQYHELK